jgi:TonB family protein
MDGIRRIAIMNLRSGFLVLATSVLSGALTLGHAQARATESKGTETHRVVGNHVGVLLMSDTAGTDLTHYMPAMIKATKSAWEEGIPSVARPPVSKQGSVTIELLLLGDGRVTNMVLLHSSGDTALDHAAWAAITSRTPYQALPGTLPQIKLRFDFGYNMERSLWDASENKDLGPAGSH